MGKTFIQVSGCRGRAHEYHKEVMLTGQPSKITYLQRYSLVLETAYYIYFALSFSFRMVNVGFFFQARVIINDF